MLDSKTERIEKVWMGMKGSVVTLLMSGDHYLEGILVDFVNPRVCLEDVQRWPLTDRHSSQVDPQSVINVGNVTISIEDILSIVGTGTRHSERKKNGKMFATDCDISQAARRGGERTLTPWQPQEPQSADSSALGAFDGSASNGNWNQFESNEKLFGIVTSFEESNYTTEIDRNAKDYQERAQEAERIAKEMMMSAKAQTRGENLHLDEERGFVGDDGDDGVDEEDRYGAVIRSYKNDSTEKQQNITTPPGINQTAMPKISYSQAVGSKSSSPSKTTLDQKGSYSPESLANAHNVIKTSSENLQTLLKSDPKLANEYREKVFSERRKSLSNEFKAFSERISAKVPPSKPSAKLSVNLNPDAPEFIPPQFVAAPTSPKTLSKISYNPDATPFIPGQSYSPAHEYSRHPHKK